VGRRRSMGHLLHAAGRGGYLGQRGRVPLRAVDGGRRISARFYFAQLKETCSLRPVKNRGALMTNIFEDTAALAKKQPYS
jgi:hypothetical protein